MVAMMMLGKILLVIACLVVAAALIVGLLQAAKKLSEQERKMLKDAITPKYYKGTEIQYYWHNARGTSIIETGTIQKVQGDSYIVSKDKHFSRIVPKHLVYDPIPEDVQNIHI